jgi:hypothetical protein
MPAISLRMNKSQAGRVDPSGEGIPDTYIAPVDGSGVRG